MDLPTQSDRPAYRPPPHLIALVDDGVLDAELAALLGLLVEERVPLVVAGDVASDRRVAVADALLAALPPLVRRIPLAGPTEDYAWLPEAEALGWRADAVTPGRVPLEPATPAETVLLGGALDGYGTNPAWAGVVRIAVRAVAMGYGLGGTIGGGSLEGVLDTLRRPPFRLTEDELSRLGVVLILDEVAEPRRTAGGDGRPTRDVIVTAAHYVRPVARDMHGHIQRMGPAVLATADAATGRFEHFAWGVIPELAARTGRRAGDLELELDRRRDALRSPVGAGAEGG